MERRRYVRHLLDYFYKMGAFEKYISWPIIIGVFAYAIHLFGLKHLIIYYGTAGALSLLLACILGYIYGVRYKKAIINYGKELKKLENRYQRDGNNLELYIQIGFTAFNARKYSRARQVFTDLIKRYPENFEGYNGMGVLELDNKNYKDARIYFEQALALNPNDQRSKDGLKYINSINRGHPIFSLSTKK